MLASLSGAGELAGQLPPALGRKIDFKQDIEPIFRAKCTTCHGADEQEGGLRLDIGRRALAGADSGAVIVPGKSQASPLMLRVAGLGDDDRMPPEDEGSPLEADQIARLRTWIDQGAAWPADADAETKRPDHWAYQPITRPEPPPVENRAWVRNGIDAFILHKLEQEGTGPSAEADRATLIRRLHLDLIGLPPSPQELARWLHEEEATWYEQLVDQLLQSPHYGERWARHWLDLARYADSDGYEKDNPRPHAWRWRTWVIRALNEDEPFDQFTVEQLAGDLLPGATLQQKVATGFHRNTLINREGGTDPEEDRNKRTVDRTNTLGKVWLGMTVECAQCHSHKYDPLTQREYYGLYAFLNSIVEPDVGAPLPDQMAAYEQASAAFASEHEKYLAAVRQYEQDQLAAALVRWTASAPDPTPVWTTLQAESARAEQGTQMLYHNLGRFRISVTSASSKPLPLHGLTDAVARILGKSPAARTEAEQAELLAYYRTIDPELAKLRAAAEAHQAKAPKSPYETTKAQVVAELPAPRTTHVLVRGDFLQPGDEVQPGVPAALPPLRARGARPDRLDLARWLVDPANPLTARVTVNRVWGRYFGRGMVASVHDFGTQGDKPSHPQLVDWLATSLRENGWRLKALHRLIVTSATYRQASAARPDLVQRDPYNAWCAHQNRLRVDAEIVRDLALSVSGLIRHRVGGPSVRPPQPASVASLGYAGSIKWQTSAGDDRYRRGLYTFFQRTVPYPMLVTFDAPDSNLSCTRRERSNTPLQALVLWNDPVFFECAQALGRRIVAEAPAGADAEATIGARILYAFELCLARAPTAADVAVVRSLIDQLDRWAEADPASVRQLLGDEAVAADRAAELATWILVGRTLMNLDEFVTRG